MLFSQALLQRVWRFLSKFGLETVTSSMSVPSEDSGSWAGTTTRPPLTSVRIPWGPVANTQQVRGPEAAGVPVPPTFQPSQAPCEKFSGTKHREMSSPFVSKYGVEVILWTLGLRRKKTVYLVDFFFFLMKLPVFQT